MDRDGSERASATRFRLVRFFTIASLAAILVVAVALGMHEHDRVGFFKTVQSEQTAFFGQVQDGFAKQQQEAARRDLIAIHEAGTVNVARLLANALWARDFGPHSARVQSIDIERCRGVPDAERKACFAEVGAKIRALPDFKALDAKVFDAMRKSTVFKVKVYDLRGVTVYSSDHSQIGEDKSANGGWKQARAGKPASQLSHRDKFGAFEGTVSDRDLLETYVPVTAATSDEVIGVFEVYSDVTPFLARIKATADETAAAAVKNMERVRAAAAVNEASADRAAQIGLVIVFGALAALLLALYLVARKADRIMAAQWHEREVMQQQLGQSEKMAALGQMVAGVAHQLNTPLAFTQNNVSLVMDRLADLEAPVRVASRLTQLVRSTPDETVVLRMGASRGQVAAIDASPDDLQTMREMLRDVLGGIGQMSELVVNMREFTRLDRASEAEFDLNRGIRTVVYMARSVIPNEIRIVEQYGELPPVACNPSQLNQVFLNLITNAAQAIHGGGTVTVRTSSDGGAVRVAVVDTGSGIPAEVLPHIFESFYTTKPRGVGTGLGLSIALEIVREHGGDIEVATEVGRGTTFTVVLPARVEAEMRAAA